MRLSQRMKESLRFVREIAKSQNMTCGRPTYHTNLVTHNALIRRGLITEANDEFHTITETAEGAKINLDE